MPNKNQAQNILTVYDYIKWFSLVNFFIFNIPVFVYVYKNINLISIQGLTVIVLLSSIILFLTSISISLLFLIHERIAVWIGFFCMAINIIALYFMINYHVILDRSMMANIFNTRYSETFEYLNFHVLILFLIPLIGLFFFCFKIAFKTDQEA